MRLLRRHTTSTGTGQPGRKSRGQSVLEMALLAPILVALLSVVIEGGLALNAWIRVTTAARDATRFVLDAGPHDQAKTLVLNKLSGIDFGAGRAYTQSTNIDIYIITGATNGSGTITSWSVDHQYGTGTATRVSQSAIQTQLRSQGTSPSANIDFSIVEVDFQYQPLLSTLIPRGAYIPMSSYALVQQY